MGIKTARTVFFSSLLVVLTLNVSEQLLYAADSPSSSVVDSSSAVEKLISEAKLNFGKGNFEAAETNMRKAIALSPHDPAVLEAALPVFFSAGKIDDLVALISAAHHKNTADMKLLYMLVVWKPHPIDERLANTMTFLRSNPGNIEAHTIAFDCCFSLHKMDEAARILTELESKGVTDAAYYYRRAKYSNYCKKYEEALNFVSKSIKDKRWKLLSLRERAFSFYKLGRYSESLKDLDTYIAEITNDATSLSRAYETRGKLYFDLKNYPESIRNFSSAIQNSDFPEANYLKRAEVYLALNKLREAKDDLRTALKLQPLNAKAHQLLSEVLFKQGKIEDSKKEASIAAKYRKG